MARCLEGLGHDVVVADSNFAPMYATVDPERKSEIRRAFETVPTLEGMPKVEFCHWLPMTSRYLFHRAD